MSNTFDLLSENEVRQITCLVETLDQSTFDFLQLELGDMKLTIGKGNAPPAAAVQAAAPVATTLAAPLAVPAPVPAPAPAAPVQAAKNDPAQEGTVAVVAPIMGRYYAKPEPGAAPFVTLGAKVDADATVGLIEVMKVFNAVRAGVSGVVTEICVQDAQFIEYGQVLVRIRPEAASSKGSRP